MAAASGSAWVLVKVGLVLLALLVGLVLLNRRVRPQVRRPKGSFTRLTAQQGVHLLEIEGRRLLIGTGPTGAPRLVCDLTGPPGRGSEAPAERRVGWDEP